MKNNINMILRVVYLTLFIYFISSCESDKSEMSILFDELKSIDNERLKMFKSSKIDSSGNFIELVNADIGKVIEKVNPDSGVALFLDSVGPLEAKIRYVAIAFHRYSNNQSYSREKTFEILKMINHYEWGNYMDEIEMEKIKIAKYNDSSLHIGDTINACFSTSNGRVVYFGLGVPEDFNCKDEENPLELVGVIVSKEFEALYPSGIDSTDIIFNVKILSVSRDSIISAGKEVKYGEIFKLHIKSYGRIIEKYGNVLN